MDYAMPSAAELPSFEASNTETPTPLQPARREGDRRVRHDRIDARRAQRRRRRGLAPRDPSHRHAVDAVQRFGRRSRGPTGTDERFVAADPAADRGAVPADRRVTVSTGLPDEACGMLVGPVIGPAATPEARGLVSEVFPAVNADASARTYTVEPATCSGPCATPTDRGRRDHRRLALAHPHRRVPVADRRPPGGRPDVGLRDREPRATTSPLLRAYRIRDGEIAEVRLSPSTVEARSRRDADRVATDRRTGMLTAVVGVTCRAWRSPCSLPTLLRAHADGAVLGRRPTARRSARSSRTSSTQYPGLADNLVDDDGDAAQVRQRVPQRRRHPVPRAARHAVSDGDVISILPAVAGG